MKLDFKNKNILFLDIDGVLSTLRQYYSNKKNWHPKYDCYKFDDKCVNVFNEICNILDPLIILSSDWKHHYTLAEMNNIFVWNKLTYKISDFTPDLWGSKYKSVQQLEECRANEILEFINKHNISNYIAIDDLNLDPWLGNNFIYTPRMNEGIKQSGIKEKIINKFKKLL